mgnify:CR=1 FL=1
MKNLPEKVQVKENEPTKLECTISGAPQPTVTWVRKGEDVKTSSENGIFLNEEAGVYSLSIDKAKAADAGVYNVSAVNRVGKVATKTELVVQSNLSFKFLFSFS